MQLQGRVAGEAVLQELCCPALVFSVHPNHAFGGQFRRNWEKGVGHPEKARNDCRGEDV